MRKLRIIIAEDEPIILEMYKNIVGKREDYEIIGTATNGKEEEELIYTIKPDVVITDNQMPIQNGIDVIEKVYNSDLVYKPKFILITGDYRDRSFLDKCEKLLDIFYKERGNYTGSNNKENNITQNNEVGQNERNYNNNMVE